MIWFTADTHFYHKNIIKYCNRPFSTLPEMNSIIIQRWNKCVKEKDTVYVLGDFSLGKLNQTEYLINTLNGKIILIPGSHDKKIPKPIENKFEIINFGTILKNPMNIGNEVVICHYAMRKWYHSHFGTWHLYGHSHGKLEPYGKSFDVGVDNHNFFPISLIDVKTRMDAIEVVQNFKFNLIQ